MALMAAALPVVSQAQSLSIQMIRAGNATLTWNATAIGPVNVQWSGNLTMWTVISEGNSNGTFTHSTGNATRSFYRLQSAFTPDSMVGVYGNATIPNLLVSNTETTWGEWKRVRTWATGNGYDIGSIGAGDGNDDRQPVQNVSWHDALKWCNARSEMEARVPVYTVNGSVYKTGNAVPTVNAVAGGYRLPTQAEWTWAAGGGVLGQSYYYSGSDEVDAVAWYHGNSGGGPRLVGSKAPNELALFDMSGNVFEWCWDAGDFSGWRVVKGGFWNGGASGCAIGSYFEQIADERSMETGFRVVRHLVD